MLLSGCLSMQSRRSLGFEKKHGSNRYMKSVGLESSERSVQLKFKDIPIPSVFRIDSGESFVFHNGVTQVGILRYVGKTEMSALTDFFKSQMPMYNWEFLNAIEYKRTILNFEKESQTCTLILEPLGGRIVITVASGPMG